MTLQALTKTLSAVEAHERGATVFLNIQDIEEISTDGPLGTRGLVEILPLSRYVLTDAGRRRLKELRVPTD